MIFHVELTRRQPWTYLRVRGMLTMDRDTALAVNGSISKKAAGFGEVLEVSSRARPLVVV